MYRTEGIQGFFKGNWANVVKIAPQTALEFYFYELFKHHLQVLHQPDPACQKGRNLSHVLTKMLCGSLTGLCVGFLIHPLELIRTQLSVNVKNLDANAWPKPTIISTGTDLFVK